MSKYYEAPTDEIFEEVKAGCIEIWNTYDNSYGYVTEKVSSIEDIANVSDNAMYMVAMFDSSNRFKLLGNLSPEARKFVDERIT